MGADGLGAGGQLLQAGRGSKPPQAGRLEHRSPPTTPLPSQYMQPHSCPRASPPPTCVMRPWATMSAGLMGTSWSSALVVGVITFWRHGGMAAGGRWGWATHVAARGSSGSRNAWRRQQVAAAAAGRTAAAWFPADPLHQCLLAPAAVLVLHERPGCASQAPAVLRSVHPLAPPPAPAPAGRSCACRRGRSCRSTRAPPPGGVGGGRPGGRRAGQLGAMWGAVCMHGMPGFTWLAPQGWVDSPHPISCGHSVPHVDLQTTHHHHHHHHHHTPLPTL